MVEADTSMQASDQPSSKVSFAFSSFDGSFNSASSRALRRNSQVTGLLGIPFSHFLIHSNIASSMFFGLFISAFLMTVYFTPREMQKSTHSFPNRGRTCLRTSSSVGARERKLGGAVCGEKMSLNSRFNEGSLH